MNSEDNPGLAATSLPGNKVLPLTFNNTSEGQECKRRCHSLPFHSLGRRHE